MSSRTSMWRAICLRALWILANWMTIRCWSRTPWRKCPKYSSCTSTQRLQEARRIFKCHQRSLFRGRTHRLRTPRSSTTFHSRRPIIHSICTISISSTSLRNSIQRCTQATTRIRIINWKRQAITDPTSGPSKARSMTPWLIRWLSSYHLVNIRSLLS